VLNHVVGNGNIPIGGGSEIAASDPDMVVVGIVALRIAAAEDIPVKNVVNSCCAEVAAAIDEDMIILATALSVPGPPMTSWNSPPSEVTEKGTPGGCSPSCGSKPGNAKLALCAGKLLVEKGDLVMPRHYLASAG
jgi:hypothetical protein